MGNKKTNTELTTGDVPKALKKKKTQQLLHKRVWAPTHIMFFAIGAMAFLATLLAGVIRILRLIFGDAIPNVSTAIYGIACIVVVVCGVVLYLNKFMFQAPKDNDQSIQELEDLNAKIEAQRHLEGGLTAPLPHHKQGRLTRADDGELVFVEDE